MENIDKEMKEVYSAVFVEKMTLGGTGAEDRFYSCNGHDGFYKVWVTRFGIKATWPMYYPGPFPGASAVGEWQGHSAPK